MLVKVIPECQLDDAISLEEACQVFPGRPSVHTVRRWIRKGIRGGLKLNAYRSGASLYTTRRCCREFILAQNADFTAPHRQATAESELASMGI